MVGSVKNHLKKQTQVAGVVTGGAVDFDIKSRRPHP